MIMIELMELLDPLTVEVRMVCMSFLLLFWLFLLKFMHHTSLNFRLEFIILCMH